MALCERVRTQGHEDTLPSDLPCIIRITVDFVCWQAGLLKGVPATVGDEVMVIKKSDRKGQVGTIQSRPLPDTWKIRLFLGRQNRMVRLETHSSIGGGGEWI